MTNIKTPMRYPLLSHLTVVAAVLATAGCGVYTSFTPTNMPPRPMQSRDPSTVSLFLTRAPTRAFVEVGILGSGHASAYSTSTDDQVIIGLRTKAAQVGCDGVVLQSESDTLFGSATKTTATVQTLKRFRAVCIMFVAAPDAKAEGQPTNIEPSR